MATISSTGIGSGLDVTSIITQLMAVEAQPLTLLQTAASTIKTEISAVGQITSLASTLQDKATALSTVGIWNSVTNSSSDTNTVSADTTAGGASPGTYSVLAKSLAAAQTLTSGVFTDATSTLSTGTLKVELGSWSSDTPPVFTAQNGSTPTSITIGAGDTSLTGIRDKINAANAGVQAAIITDANGARLSLTSSATGATNGFRLIATEDTPDGNAATGLSALGYDGSAGSVMKLNQSAANAKATVNGIDLESTTNTFTGVSTGLSLSINQVSTGPVTVKVAQDRSAIKSAINDFVTAYNSLNATIHTNTKYDATASPGQTAKKDGVLQGDPSIVGFQFQLRGIMNQDSTASSVYSRLSDIGISVQADGSLKTDGTKLDKALSTNMGDVRKLLAGQGDTLASQGFMVRFQNFLDAATGPDGQLDSRSSGLQTALNNNQKSQDSMQTRLDATQKRITTQYQNLDTAMAQANALSSYVTQQMAMLSKSA